MKNNPVHIVRNLEGTTFCGARGSVITEEEAMHSVKPGSDRLCTGCLREAKIEIDSKEVEGTTEEDESEELDTERAKAIIEDVTSMAQRFKRLARRFHNTQQQAEAVSNTLQLITAIQETGVDPDTPVEFGFRSMFRLCEHNAIDATIGGLLLPVSTVLDEILVPIATAGLTGLEAMREELAGIEEVVDDANTTYEAHTRKPDPKDLN